MRKLVIVQCVRLASKRLPRKLLQKVGDKTLLERGLDLLAQAMCNFPTVEVLIGVRETERELVDVIDSYYGFERFDLGDAADADTYAGAIAALPVRRLSDFDWAIDANFCCRPFLRWETVKTLVEAAYSRWHPFTSAIGERGILWDSSGGLLLGAGELADTRHNPQYFRLAHLCYAHPALMWNEQELADKTVPFEFPLAPLERIDIDTPADLELARLVERGMEREKLMPYC